MLEIVTSPKEENQSFYSSFDEIARDGVRKLLIEAMLEAEKNWRKIKGLADLELLVFGGKFKDRVVESVETSQQALA